MDKPIEAMSEEYMQDIRKNKMKVTVLINTEYCAPLMIGFACHFSALQNNVASVWYDAPPHNLNSRQVILYHTLKLDAKVVSTAMGLLKPIMDQFPSLSNPDLYQLVGVVALESIGGPAVAFRPGRQLKNQPPLEGHFPDPTQDGSVKHVDFTDKDVVALACGLSLVVGSYHKKRSGFEGPSCSKPVIFGNFYCKEILEKAKEGRLELPLDKALLSNPVFRLHVEKYAEDEDAFFGDYAKAHMKLSELDLPMLKPIGQTKSQKWSLKSIGKPKWMLKCVPAACFAAGLLEDSGF